MLSTTFYFSVSFFLLPLFFLSLLYADERVYFWVSVSACACKFVFYGRLVACVRTVCLIVLITIFSGNTTTRRLYAPTIAMHLFLFSGFGLRLFDLDEFLFSLKLNVTIYSLAAAVAAAHSHMSLSLVFRIHVHSHIYHLILVYKTFRWFDGVRCVGSFVRSFWCFLSFNFIFRFSTKL